MKTVPEDLLTLLERLAALGCQTFMTGTDADAFAPLGDSVQRFAVREAEVTPA